MISIQKSLKTYKTCSVALAYLTSSTNPFLLKMWVVFLNFTGNSQLMIIYLP